MSLTKILQHDFCTIFTLHRIDVQDIKKLTPNENLKIDPEYLYNFLSSSQKKGINFISLDELSYRLENHESLKKTAVITIDDGYKDNAVNGQPIFESTSTPYTIYIATDMPDRKSILWWFFLEDLLLKHSKVRMGNEIITLSTKREKEVAFMKIRRDVLNRAPSDTIKHIEHLFDASYDSDHYNNIYPITWDQILAAKMNHLCTISAHSVTHPNLKNLDENSALEEMCRSKSIIEKITNTPVNHFAYPFGSSEECNAREFSLAKKAGFKTATTTYWGAVFNRHSDSLTALPRVRLHSQFNWESAKFKMMAKAILEGWNTYE